MQKEKRKRRVAPVEAPSDGMMRAAAKLLHHEDGECEIDDTAAVSRAEGNPEKGAYVESWVWVPDDAANPRRILGDSRRMSNQELIEDIAGELGLGQKDGVFILNPGAEWDSTTADAIARLILENRGRRKR